MNTAFADRHLRDAALQAVGFLGSWQIDYTMWRARADGQVGDVLGLAPDRFAEGIGLDQWDGAIVPEDFNSIEQLRRMAQHRNGAARLRYRLRSPIHLNVGTVESIAVIERDRDGHLVGARGMMFDASIFGAALITSGKGPAPDPSAQTSDMALDTLSGRVLQVGREARALGLPEVEADLARAARRLGDLLGGRLRRAWWH